MIYIQSLIFDTITETKTTQCDTHKREFVVYCETCECPYCPQCTHEPHATVSLLHALSAEELEEELPAIQEELKQVDAGIEQVRNFTTELSGKQVFEVQKRMADLIKEEMLRNGKIREVASECTLRMVKEVSEMSEKYKKVRANAAARCSGMEEVLEAAKKEYGGSTTKAYESLLRHRELTDEKALEKLRADIKELADRRKKFEDSMKGSGGAPEMGKIEETLKNADMLKQKETIEKLTKDLDEKAKRIQELEEAGKQKDKKIAELTTELDKSVAARTELEKKSKENFKELAIKVADLLLTQNALTEAGT